MTLTRNRFADLLTIAEQIGSYAFWPVLPPGQDPQLLVSRNSETQPFHLVHEHDAVLAHLGGHATVEFPEGPVRWHDLRPGDHVYLPAGLPYRVVADSTCVQVLIKADLPALEAVVWYCDNCGHVVDREDFEIGSEPLQRSYHRVCEEFNGSEKRRTCSNCGTLHPTIDLESFDWLSLADQIDNPAPAPEATWAQA
jgi:hypothetical protein